jgi:hypothetical protein
MLQYLNADRYLLQGIAGVVWVEAVARQLRCLAIALQVGNVSVELQLN